MRTISKDIIVASVSEEKAIQKALIEAIHKIGFLPSPTRLTLSRVFKIMVESIADLSPSLFEAFLGALTTLQVAHPMVNGLDLSTGRYKGSYDRIPNQEKDREGFDSKIQKRRTKRKRNWASLLAKYDLTDETVKAILKGKVPDNVDVSPFVLKGTDRETDAMTMINILRHDLDVCRSDIDFLRKTNWELQMELKSRPVAET